MVEKMFSALGSQFSVLGFRFSDACRRAAIPSFSDDREPRTEDRASGFTLLELLIVMTIIAILSAIAIPSFVSNVRHAREAVLKEDLHTMRGAIEQYTFDKQKAPQSLDELVQSHYLREMPVDPFTQRSDTWIPSQGDEYVSIDETQSGGITDVHSGSQQISTEGSTYNTW